MELEPYPTANYEFIVWFANYTFLQDYRKRL